MAGINPASNKSLASVLLGIGKNFTRNPLILALVVSVIFSILALITIVAMRRVLALTVAVILV